MFEIGATELLLIVVIAIVVIGPKDMPRAMRTAGRWVGKLRRMSAHVRTGIDAMIREAEMEELEKEWKERNARIMAETPPAEARLSETQAPASAEARAGNTPSRQETPKAPGPDGPPPPP